VRREPGEDLVRGLIAAEEQGQILSEDEMLATAMLLLVAGNETTTNLIGNGMLSLLRNPEQMEKLRADPSLVPAAGGEMEEREIGGQQVTQGQAVLTVLGAANRDPARFEKPDELDLGREPNEHVAFGDGIHFCLGAPLARAEGRIAFEALLAGCGNTRLVRGE